MDLRFLIYGFDHGGPKSSMWTIAGLFALALEILLRKKKPAADPDPETRGILQINKALLLNRRGDHDTAVSLLRELTKDPHVPLGIEHIAKSTLATFVNKNSC